MATMTIPTATAPTTPATTPVPDQPGPSRPGGTSRTDTELIALIRAMYRDDGTPPSITAVKKELNIGSGRATRLLSQDLNTANRALVGTP